ncbi:MAG: hypothetical protein FWH12_09015 [Treponema sp.]|nr:hypothetical protein [Treponema sp.]
MDRASLDDIGEALKERINGLQVSENTPYTVLSLIKTYCAFQWAVCLSLRESHYLAYASIGLDTDNIKIPLDLIWKNNLEDEVFFSLDHIRDRIVISNVKEQGIWGFPILSRERKKNSPWDGILVMSVSDPSFQAAVIPALLGGASDKILYQGSKNNAHTNRTLQGMLQHYMEHHPVFNCILFENPVLVEGQYPESMYDNIAAMIGEAGVVIPMPDERPLVLLPIKIDRELLLHRISKSLHAEPLISFESNNISTALSRINSFY